MAKEKEWGHKLEKKNKDIHMWMQKIKFKHLDRWHQQENGFILARER